MAKHQPICYTSFVMEMKQKLELRRHLIPELAQSLNVLALPLLDIKALVEKELEDNPFLEELTPKEPLTKIKRSPPSSSYQGDNNFDFRASLLTKKTTLQDVLLRQLGMFTNTDEDFRIGQEIIGNIDENGYLQATLEEIAHAMQAAPDEIENVLKLIHEFEPAGVGARTISECLLIQLKLQNENNPLVWKIAESYLDDLAKKNYTRIAKCLKEPLETIEPCIKKILKLDPKPGRNYSAEETHNVAPDIFVYDNGDDLEVTINNEDLPTLAVNQTYRQMLKDKNIDPQTKDFLNEKFRSALELLRAISRRHVTIRKIVEVVMEIQQEAIKENFSRLKPLTFKEVADRIDMHESTVCRAVMNKYMKLPYGVVALKDFFTSHVHDHNGQSISSVRVKNLIKKLIAKEDKKHPVSDQDITRILSEEEQLNVSRRTVAKYREELRILSSTFRKER